MSYNLNLDDKIKNLVGESLDSFTKNKFVDEISKAKQLNYIEEYQGRIIDCMVGEVDDNYIETPETDANIVKLENSKEGVIKIPSIKGKTILVNEYGYETSISGEGCRLVSVGEEEDNKLIFVSKNKNLFDGYDTLINIEHITNMKITSDTTIGCERILLSFYDENGEFINDNTLQVGNNFYYRNADGFWMLGANNTKLNHNIILTRSVKYIKLTNHNGFYRQYDNIQLEEGLIGTTYTKPQSHKTEILLNEPLRGLSNDICDEISNKNIVRKINILNGVDRFRKNGIYNNTKGSRFIMTLNDAKQIKNIIVKSNLIPFKVTNSSWKEEGFYIATDEFGANNSINIRLNEDLSLEEFKDKYKNLTIYYELAEPIIEELPNGITLQGFDDTTMYIENSITPTVVYGYNALIPYKEEVLSQKEEVANNIDLIAECQSLISMLDITLNDLGADV